MNRDGADSSSWGRFVGGSSRSVGATRKASRILPIDAVVAERWGRLNVPDPLRAVDGLLAATALVHDLSVVSRNVRDFARAGVRGVDPFEAG
jgi:predicted nucleic acid-binding protein